MICEFSNAGEIWTMIGAITSFILVVLALYPILREFFHHLKYKNLIRNRILFEIRNIHESYFGKILSQLSAFITKQVFPFTVYNQDIKYFEIIESLFEKTIYLSNKENRLIRSIVEIFRKFTYRKISEEFYMMSYDVVNIENISSSLIWLIQKKLGEKLSILKIRENSHKRITEAASLMKKTYPSFSEIIILLDPKSQLTKKE